jgi:hypothetical protein
MLGFYARRWAPDAARPAVRCAAAAARAYAVTGLADDGVEEDVMLTLRPYMWIGDAPVPSNPEYPEVDFVCADVFDADGRMVGSVWRVHETEWRIARTKGGKWTGDYATKDEALGPLQGNVA